MIRPLLVALVLAMAPAAAQVAVPDTEAGEWATEFVDLVNARDEAGLEAFVRDSLDSRMLAMMGGPERASHELMSLYSGLGPLQIVGLDEREVATLYLRGTLTGGWVALHLLMEPGAGGAPARVERLAVALDERPPGTPPAEALSDEALPAAVDAYLERLAAHDLFSGVVMIARGDRTLYAGAFGAANRAGDPVTLDTGFALASVSKTFTALAVLQLAEDGRIDLDDPLTRYLPDDRAVSLEGITLRHLLTHGSGLGNFDLARIRPLRTVAEMARLPIDPPAFEPGSAYRYSNTGYVLLGAVVERVTGQDFYAYLDEHVFAPAGMTRTGGFDLAGEPEGIATGFGRMRPDGTRPHDLDGRVRRGSPAADLVSTGPDLVRYGRALLDGTLLGEPWRTEAMSPQRPVPSRPVVATSYGYGLFVQERDGVVSVGHGGGAAGASTSFTVVPEGDLVVVVLSNYELVGDVVARSLKERTGPRRP